MCHDYTPWIHSGYEAFCEALKISGVPTEEVEHGLAFTPVGGVRMIVEEYLKVSDSEDYGTSEMALAVYAEGQRPLLYTRVYGCHRQWWQEDFPYPVQNLDCENGLLPDFTYCLNDGSVSIDEEDEGLIELTKSEDGKLYLLRDLRPGALRA